MMPTMTNMLSPWQWALSGAVPPAIIALYFLKLRRRSVRVPSTILWRRSLEDMHVNSLFQRLRRNLLLFLQLLAVALAMLALAGPHVKGTGGQGQRFVLMIDNSASMTATDVAPSRLDKAKEAAKKVVSSGSDGICHQCSIASNRPSNQMALIAVPSWSSTFTSTPTSRSCRSIACATFSRMA